MRGLAASAGKAAAASSELGRSIRAESTRGSGLATASASWSEACGAGEASSRIVVLGGEVAGSIAGLAASARDAAAVSSELGRSFRDPTGGSTHGSGLETAALT
jgi:hypothetical protein